MLESNEVNKPDAIDQVRKGETVSAKQWNSMATAMNRVFQGVALPKQVRRNGLGAAGAGIEVQQFIIASTAGDYIVAYKYNGVATGTEGIPIAKPWELRRSQFDGDERAGIIYTFSDDETREADDLTNTETQVVIPSYVVGDVIFAMTGISGGTGLTVNLGDGTPFNVEWQDMNLGSRAWAKQA